MNRATIEPRIKTFMKHCARWGGYNQFMTQTLFITSLLLAAAITISGLFGYSKTAGVIGAISTAIIAYRGYAKNEVAARWYGKAVIVCEGLLAELEKATTSQDYDLISDKLEHLRTGDNFWGSDPATQQTSQQPQDPQTTQTRNQTEKLDKQKIDAIPSSVPSTSSVNLVTPMTLEKTKLVGDLPIVDEGTIAKEAARGEQIVIR